MRVAELSPTERWRMAKARAYEHANYRWGEEMSYKYNVPYRDEEDFVNANLMASEDHRRYMEILDEELALVAHFDPGSPSFVPTARIAGIEEASERGPDEASGLLISDLLGVDDRSITADLDRIETELRGLRDQIGDTDKSR